MCSNLVLRPQNLVFLFLGQCLGGTGREGERERGRKRYRKKERERERKKETRRRGGRERRERI